MLNDSYSSKLLQNAVAELAKLPGVGNRTALRLALHLLSKSSEDVNIFGSTIIKMRDEIKYCNSCNNISDTELCEICANPVRNAKLICVVESIKDVIAVEKTDQFKGIYHVLGGIISPMDGVGPDDLKIRNLEQKLEQGKVDELVLALSTTMEGDTTNYYLFKRFSKFNKPITVLARGVSIGDELEYADELTLGRSIINRVPFSL